MVMLLRHELWNTDLHGDNKERLVQAWQLISQFRKSWCRVGGYAIGYYIFSRKKFPISDVYTNVCECLFFVCDSANSYPRAFTCCHITMSTLLHSGQWIQRTYQFCQHNTECQASNLRPLVLEADEPIKPPSAFFLMNLMTFC